MMKCVLGFVLLLHLCYSDNATFSLSQEIIRRLEELNTHYKDITLPDNMQVPSEPMRRKASSCVGVCIQELQLTIKNVTVDEELRYILTKLNGSLNKLRSLGYVSQNVDSCKMIRKRSLRPFTPYINFFKKLNSMLI